jgi:hypothetical protein
MLASARVHSEAAEPGDEQRTLEEGVQVAPQAVASVEDVESGKPPEPPPQNGSARPSPPPVPATCLLLVRQSAPAVLACLVGFFAVLGLAYAFGYFVYNPVGIFILSILPSVVILGYLFRSFWRGTLLVQGVASFLEGVVVRDPCVLPSLEPRVSV